jgi:hypothetical protein
MWLGRQTSAGAETTQEQYKGMEKTLAFMYGHCSVDL